MPDQKCPLCLETKNVVVSHLMPAAMHDYCRPPGGHTLSVSSDLVIESDLQLQNYLLCNDCEQNLDRGGETWLLPLLLRYKGPFPFHELLTRVAPDVVDEDVEAYAGARNPEIDCNKIIHFALGVFWKAAVHSWSGSRTAPMNNLAVYAEPIRHFLRGMPVVEEVGTDLGQGPVLVKIECAVISLRTAEFVEAMHQYGRVRRRDGAYRWGISPDTEVANRYLEIFLVNSWAEHLRQHERQTQADRELEGRIFSYLAGEPVVRHLIYTYTKET